VPWAFQTWAHGSGLTLKETTDPLCVWCTKGLKIREWSEWLPSGYVKIAIENGHRNSGFTQLENSYVSLPEGNMEIYG